jgi:TetR/AcrR family transcriptional regulator, transcriptional repressor for nem operon
MNTKEHIINKAFGLFMTTSYKEVSMSLILKKTGLSKGAFYHHFESKEALFEQVVDQFFFAVASDIGFQPSPDVGFLENMDNFFLQKQVAFQMFADQLGVEHSEINFFMFIMQAIQYLPGVRQKVYMYIYKEKKQLESIIEIAQQQNEIKSEVDSSKFAEQLMLLFDGAELHGVLLSQSFETISRQREMLKQLYSWVKNH